MEEKNKLSYRSLFWPIILIGLGTLWLLANLGILPDINWRFFLRLWPLILVIIGLDIIFGRRTPLVGVLLGLGAVATVIALILLAPSLNLDTNADLKTLSFSEPLEGATSARVDLQLDRYATTVDSFTDSNVLVEADIDTLSDVIFEVRGEKTKSVRIEPSSDFTSSFDWTDLDDAEWNINLSPTIPMELSVDVGSGSATLKLSNLQLTDFDINGGSGSTDLFLPATSARYSASINGGSGSFYIELENNSKITTDINVGSGSFDVVIGSGSDVEATIEGGSGSLDIDVPNNVGVQIEVRDHGSGSVNIPASYDLVDDMDDNDEDTGIWETDGYENASYKIVINLDPGSGSVSIR